MKTILKITRGNIKSSGKRAVMTLLGVTLSVTLITLVCVVCSSIMSGVYRTVDDPSEIGSFRTMCNIFTVIASVMGCVMIFSAFSVGFSGRIRLIGLLTSVGASAMQKSAIVVLEALIYGVAAVAIGIPLGTLAAMLFYDSGAGIIAAAGVDVGTFSPSPSSFLLSAALGIVTVLAASVFPMLKLRHISVMDSIYGRTKINISLRPGLFARFTERVFGYFGRLAGQNYDNNKGTYHAISLTLSGGTAMFYAVYSFFMYFFRYDSLDSLYGTQKARPATIPDILFGFRLDGKYAAEHDPELVTAFFLCMILAMLFVAISLLCAAGGASVSMDRRRGEHAMLKSVGMQNSELCRVMCIECVYLTFYSALYGLVGALAVDYAMCTFLRIVSNETMLGFYFPVMPYLSFVMLDIAVGLLFAVYAALRVRRVNIIETIRGV